MRIPPNDWHDKMTWWEMVICGITGITSFLVFVDPITPWRVASLTGAVVLALRALYRISERPDAHPHRDSQEQA